MDGICGMCAKGKRARANCPSTVRECMFRLQHRGQQFCGTASVSDSKINVNVSAGMVLNNIENGNLGGTGNFCIGHTSSADPQPVAMDFAGGSFAIGFDGFIANSVSIRQQLLNNGYGLRTDHQIEWLAGLIVRARDVEHGLKDLLNRVQGPFSVVALTPSGIYAARDGWGMRPLVIGRAKGAWAVASESCAFYGTGLELVRDVMPGEIIFFDDEVCETVEVIPKSRKICSFEWVYFARPDSTIEGVSVTQVRHDLGRFLAEIETVEADVVGPVPFSGIMHAEGYHLASSTPSVEVFLPPRYLGRTYIRPYDQRVAEQAKKLVPVAENVKGKSVILVDDSIRAGVAMKGTVEALRQAGAREVHVRIASPVSIRDCPHSRPPGDGEYFIGRTMTVEQIRQQIGADSLVYQEIGNVAKAIGLPENDLCLDCFL